MPPGNNRSDYFIVKRIIRVSVYILVCLQLNPFSGNPGEISLTNPSLLSNGTLIAAPLSASIQQDRLWIFYGDTAAYDESAGITGCAGLRVPVTIRAQSDNATINTTRTTPFEIILSNGLAAYATQTAADKITAGQLIAGKAIIWIQAIWKNVNNGSITVVSKDPDVASSDRNNITFNACFKQIETAAYFTNNGRGSVDRVEIFYDSPLEAAEIPDSLLFYWPDTSGESRMVYRWNITHDTADLSHLTVTIPVPFSEGVTRYSKSGANLGKSFWFNTATPETPTIEYSFNIADSVGPVLSNAVLIERLNAGNDTLNIDFTETVEYQLVQGVSLILIKDNMLIPLNIISARQDPNGHSIIAVITDLVMDAPKEGDSLMISSTGPIADGFGNRVHPQNRPVALSLIKIAPDIVRAVYEDRDANGIIETVQMTFNKGVHLGGMKMQFRWNSSISLFTADSTRFTFAKNGGDTTVDVNIIGLFNASAVKDKTSGNMDVTVMFSDFAENNIKQIMAIDGAAPVLTLLSYNYGKYRDEHFGADPDTVYALFTEELRGAPNTDQPFLFQDSLGNPYTAVVSYLGRTTLVIEDHYKYPSTYQFEVTSLQAGVHPVAVDTAQINGTLVISKGDSAWINTDASIVDNNVVDANFFGNVQRNPANRRVGIYTELREFEYFDSTTYEQKSPYSQPCGGCGTGTGLAFIPPLFFFARNKIRRKKGL